MCHVHFAVGSVHIDRFGVVKYNVTSAEVQHIYTWLEVIKSCGNTCSSWAITLPISCGERIPLCPCSTCHALLESKTFLIFLWNPENLRQCLLVSTSPGLCPQLMGEFETELIDQNGILTLMGFVVRS